MVVLAAAAMLACPPAPALDGGAAVAMGRAFALVDAQGRSQGQLAPQREEWLFKTPEGKLAGSMHVDKRSEQTLVTVRDCDHKPVGRLSLLLDGTLRVFDARGLELAAGSPRALSGFSDSASIVRQGETWRIRTTFDSRLAVAAAWLDRQTGSEP